MNDTLIRERLDLAHIAEAAEWAAARLDYDCCAVVYLTPNDGTVYHIVIVKPQIAFQREGVRDPREFTVCLVNRHGRSYPWAGGRMHCDYVTSKWVGDDHLWTGVVLTEFLNALSTHLEESP